jgi:MFS family permease
VAALLTIPAALGAVAVWLTDFDEERAVSAVGDGGEEPGDGVEQGEPDSGPGDAPSTWSSFVADSRALFAGAFPIVFGVVIMEGLYYRGALTFLPDLLVGFEVFEPVRLFTRTLDPGRYLYAGILTVGLVGQYVGGRLTDRFPVEYGLMGSYVGLGTVAVLFVPAVEAGVGPLLAASVVLGLFLFAEQPFLQATVAEYSPPSVRGLSYGYTYVGVFGVGALGATITGIVLTVAGPRELFLTLAGFAAAGLLLAVVLSRTDRSVGMG